jgi:hypothetical protein
MEISPELVTLITTIATIVLGIIAKKYHGERNTAVAGLSIISDKAAKLQNVVNKIIAAQKDTAVTDDEFKGIIGAIEELIAKPLNTE